MAVRQGLSFLKRRTGNYAYLDTETVLHPDEPATLPGDLYYRYREATPTVRALAAILAREGAELSATETLRAALVDVESLARLVPEYDYGHEVYRGSLAQEQAEQWIRDAFPDPDGEVDATDVLADAAWPALRAVLYRFADVGTDPVVVLRKRAAERDFASDPNDPARSAAQVLHHRLVRHVPDQDHSADRPDLLPGWVVSPPVADPSDSDQDHAELGDWLRHRANRIADRVRVLGERAVNVPLAWTADLGDVPDDLITREVWIGRAGHVAAYRERWHIADDNAVTLPPCDRGEQGRARKWLVRYLHEHPLAEPVAEGNCQGARTDRVRSRLGTIKRLMSRGPEVSPVSESAPGLGSVADTVTEAGQEMDVGP